MNTKDFLEKAVGRDGWYCVFALNRASDKRIQKFYKTLAEVEAAAQNFDQQGFDTFFGLATFGDDKGRTAGNAKSMSAMFLDLDCGPTKDYADKNSAITALRVFCEELKLPTPTMVDSGRGIHAYWFLAEPVPVAVWVPVAERLKQVCAEKKLFADPAVTSDTARILRVPETHNYKADPPLPVMLLGQELTPPIALSTFGDKLGSSGLGFTPLMTIDSAENAVMTALMGNSSSSFRTILEKTRKGKGCQQLQLIVSDQANCSEPMWRAGLSIAKFCDDPHNTARKMSQQHPAYTQEATEQKMAEIKGPYTCAVFNDNNPGVCDGCPNFGKITSPITLGKYVAEARDEDNVVEEAADGSTGEDGQPVITYAIPKYPKPYFRGANGGVYLRKKGDDGDFEDVTVYHNDLYVVKRLTDVEIGECVVMRLHLPQDGVKEFMVPLTAVTSKEELRKELAKKGVAVPKMDALMHYITTWVNQLQATTMAENAHRMFGWVGPDFDQFILGPFDIRKDKILTNHASSATAGIMPAFIPKGTLEGWKEAIKMYDREGFEGHQFVVARSFGSLLMAMTSQNGTNMHLYSKDSGLGKTTATYAGLAAFGNPKELILDKNDTTASKMNRAEMYHNLPLVLDEVTNIKGDEASQLAYDISNGKQRNRMQGSANTERLRGESWQLLAFTTANTSLVEIITSVKTAPKAEALRTLEYEVPTLIHSTEMKKLTDGFIGQLLKNYGHAAIPFVQYIMKDPAAIMQLMTEVQAKVDVAGGLSAEHRFWSLDVACSLTAAIICLRIGLLPYCTKGLFKFAIALIKTNKRNLLSLDATTQDVIGEFIYEHMPNMLQITSTADNRHGEGMDQLVVPNMTPKGGLIIRYETDKKRAYIIAKNLREWCIKRQINYASLVKDAEETMNGKREKVRISKGTPLQMPPTNVISIACDVDRMVKDKDGTGTENESDVP